jgi:hypothetical protein
MWPLALITHFGLGGYTPLLVQDVAVVATEVIAFSWILRLLRDRADHLPLPDWALGAISLLLLVVNPWIYWAVSFDVHLDITLAAPFVVLALRSLYYRQYRWLWLWVVLGLLCGDVASSYLAAVGLCGMLAARAGGRRLLVTSGAVFVVSSITFVVITHLQGGAGAAFVVTQTVDPSGAQTASAFDKIGAVLLHPGDITSSMWEHRKNLWALISPAGVLGLTSVWALPLVLVVAVENSVAGSLFTFPAFQYAALWGPLVVAGVISAARSVRRRWVRRLAAGLLVLSAANTVGWAAVWLPQVPTQWQRVDSPTAAALDRAQRLIPDDAEVLASQGVVGRFADRSWVYALPGTAADVRPVRTRDVYFVVVPYQGIETVPVDRTLGLIGRLAGPMHASLLQHGDGVWVFRWIPPPGTRQVALNATRSPESVPAWAAQSAVGQPVLTGPASDWRLTARSGATEGYLLHGAYFTRPPGDYVLRVRLASTATTNVEAWNANGDVLLGRRIVPPTDGITTVEVPVPSTRAYPPKVFTGRFGFTAAPPPPPPGQVVEARVHVPANTTATVYSVRLVAANR